MGTANLKKLTLSFVEQDITLDVVNDKLQVRGNIKGLSAETKNLIKANKERIIEYIKQRKRAASSTITRRSPDANIPLSFARQRLWLHGRLSAKTNDLGIDAVVELKAGTGKMPIYMVPGLAGHAHIFQQLAVQLTTDQSVYAFNPLGIDGEDKPHDNVADAAAYYAELLIAHYDCGSCILVGYSLGASVACEIAKILTAQGYQVPLLVVLDGKAEYDNIAQTIDFNDAIGEQQQNADVSVQMSQQIEHIKGIIEAQSQWQDQTQQPIEVYRSNGTHESILTPSEVKSIAQFMQKLM